MDTKINNPSAFPRVNAPLQHPILDPGLTMLDWFAGQALAGLNANADHSCRNHMFIAELAYNDAEAMLAAQ
jgi:hypothetical protein